MTNEPTMFSQIRENITKVRRELETVRATKEKFFQDKEALNATIASIIKEIQVARSNRNQVTAEVKRNKDIRSIVNIEIKHLVQQIKKEPPSGNIAHHHKLQKSIQAIELQVETEALTFSREQKLMKQLKILKKEWAPVQEIAAKNKHRRLLEHDLAILRKHGQVLHQYIQRRAKESQLIHENVLTISKSIEDLRKQEREMFKKFIEQKALYINLTKKFKSLQKDLEPLQKSAENQKQERRQTKQQHIEKQLQRSAEQVEEKIKKGKTLTTEDLIKFQGKT